MKKLLITALIAVGFSSLSFSQDKGKIEFGVLVGYSGSTVSTSDDNSADNLSGINFGVSGDYYFSDRWSIKVKALYDQKGWEERTINDFGEIYNGKFRMNYLTVPVMANWHFAAKRNWYLNFGPYVGFLLNAKETVTDMDFKDGINSTDFGLALGIGVKIPVSDKLKVFLEFDGQGGLSDAFKSDEIGTVTNTRSSFNVGMNFLLQ